MISIAKYNLARELAREMTDERNDARFMHDASRVTRLLVMRNNLTVYVPARWKILLDQNISRNNLCHVLVLVEDA